MSRLKLAAKCDKRLGWWIRLANLHLQVLPAVSNPIAGNKGFSDQVRKLKGPRPQGVDVLLSPRYQMRDLLVGVGSDPDKYLWGLAGVTNSVLSKISELGEAQQFPKEVVFADWTSFAAPLTLSVSTSGEVAEADRPEPLVDLLSIIRGMSVNTIGTCPICRKLFERLRSDQMCDSRRCRDTHRQRLYRAQQPKYEANRRRYRKEGIKAKERGRLSAALRDGSRLRPDAEPFAVAFNDLAPEKRHEDLKNASTVVSNNRKTRRALPCCPREKNK
jgi:hypothetical protein